jgi:hypothetical protein
VPSLNTFPQGGIPVWLREVIPFEFSGHLIGKLLDVVSKIGQKGSTFCRQQAAGNFGDNITFSNLELVHIVRGEILGLVCKNRWMKGAQTRLALDKDLLAEF